MKTLWKLSAGALLASSLLLGPSYAQDKPQPVARVTKISDKGRMDFSRGDAKWFQAYIDMKDFVDDKLKTDANTFGSIEFYTGGQIGINKNTTVEITSQNKVNTINIKSGGIWSKMSKQTDPLQIRTSSGVMGIKGTEFVVTETANGTELSVLEGQVEVTPANGGAPTQVMPGTQVLLDLQKVEVVKQGSASDLRSSIQNSSEWNDFNKALQWASYITSYIPQAGGVVGNVGYYGGMAVDLVNDPGQALTNMAVNEVQRFSPIGIPIPSRKPEPDFPSELSPDFQAAAGSPLPPSAVNFQWKGLKKAQEYVVLVSRDEDANDLVWSGQTKDTKLAYPSQAQPLAPGKYFWRVIGLDKKDKPVGKAAQTWFEVAAP